MVRVAAKQCKAKYVANSIKTNLKCEYKNFENKIQLNIKTCTSKNKKIKVRTKKGLFFLEREKIYRG